MNSTCRSIDLATNIIAPIVVGQVMYFVSHIMAAVIIAGWNVVSYFVESFLLWRIYNKFSKLALKERASAKDEAGLLKGSRIVQPTEDETTSLTSFRFQRKNRRK